MLIYKLESVGRKDNPLTDRINALFAMGNDHDVPWPLPGMKEISERDYWRHAMTYTFKADIYVGHVQIEKDHATVRAFLIDEGRMRGAGYAVAELYSAKKILYFEWSTCQHKWSSVNTGRCLNKYTCDHCKYSYEVDSSD